MPYIRKTEENPTLLEKAFAGKIDFENGYYRLTQDIECTHGKMTKGSTVLVECRDCFHHEDVPPSCVLLNIKDNDGNDDDVMFFKPLGNILYQEFTDFCKTHFRRE